jgi:hypothetical protein
VLVAFACIAGVRFAHAGPAGFAFLEIPAGARASAMGGAYASIATGVEAAFWNPAGLDAARGTQVTASHFELYQNFRNDQFAIAGHLLGGGVAASMRALYSEPIEERDELGNLTGSFGGHDLEFALGYGTMVAAGLRAGGTVQTVRERIANLAATTYSMGLGVTWDPEFLSGSRWSLSAHNLGSSAAYPIDGAGPVDLPSAVQGGFSYGRVLAPGLDLRGAVETRVTRGRSGVAMIGGELSSPAGAALRLGFRVNDSSTSFSVGAGYARNVLRLDYAFVPSLLDLGDTHRVSFTTQF